MNGTNRRVKGEQKMKYTVPYEDVKNVLRLVDKEIEQYANAHETEKARNNKEAANTWLNCQIALGEVREIIVSNLCRKDRLNAE